MQLSDKGLHFIMAHEGVRLAAYPDPGSGGEPWTIGVGHTGGVRPGDTCTMDQAMAWLRSDVAWAEAAVNSQCRAPLTQDQFDALVDFTFNEGTGNFSSSTLLRLLNADPPDYEGADRQFARWNQAAGRVLPGLVTRRADEAAMFEDSSA